MNDFFAPAIPAETIMSDRLRIRMVDGDGLEPDLMSRRDYVLIAPTDRYRGEGIYLLDWGPGPVLYQVQYAGSGEILMRYTNPKYRDDGHVFHVDKFNEMVLGFVVADVKVRQEHTLRQIMEAGKL